MAVGDVLLLQSALAAPITLLSESGRRIADGTLGRVDRNLALRVTQLAALPASMPADSPKRSIR